MTFIASSASSFKNRKSAADHTILVRWTQNFVASHILPNKFPPQPLDVTNQLESGSAVQVTQPQLDNPPDVLYWIEVESVPSPGNNSDFIVTENSPAGE